MNCTTLATVSAPPVWAMSMPSIARGCRCHVQNLLQAGQAFLRIDGKDLRLHVGFQAAALVERFQQVDFVAQPGGLLELQCRGRGRHVFAHLAQERLPLPFQERVAVGECSCGIPPAKCGGCTAPNTGRSRPAGRGETIASGSRPSSMSREQVRNLKIFCKIASARAATAN